MNIATLKAHAEAYISSMMGGIDSAYHTAVRDFTNFVEGAEAEVQRAVDLLKSKGYTVTPAPDPVTPPVAVPADGPPPTDPPH